MTAPSSPPSLASLATQVIKNIRELHAFNPTNAKGPETAVVPWSNRYGQHWTQELIQGLEILATIPEACITKGNDGIFYFSDSPENIAQFFSSIQNNPNIQQQYAAKVTQLAQPAPAPSLAEFSLLPSSDGAAIDGGTPDGLAAGQKRIAGLDVAYAHDPNIRAGRYSEDNDAAYVAALNIPSDGIGAYIQEGFQAAVDRTSRMTGIEGGSTMSMLVYDPERHQLHFATLGDSPIYLQLEDGKGRSVTVRLSTDDNIGTAIAEGTVPADRLPALMQQHKRTEEQAKAIIYKGLKTGNNDSPRTYDSQTPTQPFTSPLDLDALARQLGFDPATVQMTAINACDGPFEGLADSLEQRDRHNQQVNARLKGDNKAQNLLKSADSRDNETAFAIRLQRGAPTKIVSCIFDGNGTQGYQYAAAAHNAVQQCTRKRNHTAVVELQTQLNTLIHLYSPQANTTSPAEYFTLAMNEQGFVTVRPGRDFEGSYQTFKDSVPDNLREMLRGMKPDATPQRSPSEINREVRSAMNLMAINVMKEMQNKLNQFISEFAAATASNYISLVSSEEGKIVLDSQRIPDRVHLPREITDYIQSLNDEGRRPSPSTLSELDGLLARHKEARMPSLTQQNDARAHAVAQKIRGCPR